MDEPQAAADAISSAFMPLWAAPSLPTSVIDANAGRRRRCGHTRWADPDVREQCLVEDIWIDHQSQAGRKVPVDDLANMHGRASLMAWQRRPRNQLLDLVDRLRPRVPDGVGGRTGDKAFSA